MKILIFGANGFIGKNVVTALKTDHTIIAVGRGLGARDGYDIDLANLDEVRSLVDAVKPDAILNCAGVVSNDESAKLNPVFTENILQAVVDAGLQPKKIIILGSAGEYGNVSPDRSPVKEDTPTHAISVYGQSKIDETTVAMKFRDQYGLPVVIARLFNPIGTAMNPRMLLPALIQQVRDIQSGELSELQINRLDSVRDYIAIEDIARAIKLLVEGQTKYSIYNIGSGVATTNKQLVDLILENSTLADRPSIIETADKPEAPVASQADISRLRDEFGWEPGHSLESIVKEILHVTD